MTNRNGSGAVTSAASVAVLVSVLIAATPSQEKRAVADPAQIARGDSIYHGKLGGAVCAVCHGQNAKGMPGMGPDLTDKVWLHGDGTPEFIARIIRTGVSKPRQSAAVMPPFGGTPLDSAKVEAVAAYVYSLGVAGR